MHFALQSTLHECYNNIQKTKHNIVRSMKNMSKKSIVFLVLPVIVLAAAAFYWGVRLQESQYEVFSQEGYIISSTYENASINTTKYYFTEDTKYKTNYNSQVSFNNSDNEEVQVDNTAYVHYINGGIGVLKKTALLDLNTLATGEGTLVKYYNMFPTSILFPLRKSFTLIFFAFSP